MANNTVWAKGNQHPRSSYDRCCWRPGRIAVLPGLVTLDNHLIRSSSDVRNGCGKTTADKCFRTVNREGKPFFSKDRDKVLAEVVAILRADLDPRILVRKSVVEGKSVSVRVDLGVRRIIKKKNIKKQKN